MSLALKLSEIRARGVDILASTDGRAALDLLAADLTPMLDALDRYENTLTNFGDQRWAMRDLKQTCDDFGIVPPPTITPPTIKKT